MDDIVLFLNELLKELRSMDVPQSILDKISNKIDTICANRSMDSGLDLINH